MRKIQKIQKILLIVILLVIVFSCFEFSVIAEDELLHEHTENCCPQEEQSNGELIIGSHLEQQRIDSDEEIINNISEQELTLDNNLIIDSNINISIERQLTYACSTDTYYILSRISENKIILKNNLTKEETVLYEGTINDVSQNGDAVYVATNNKIVYITEDGVQTDIFTGIGNISHVVAYNEIIFFVEDGILYSILPDGTQITELYTVNEITMLDGVSTTKVMWQIKVHNDSVVSKFDMNNYEGAGALFFLYDISTAQLSLIEDWEFYELYADYVPMVEESEVGTNEVGISENFFTTSIHGVSLPLSNYVPSDNEDTDVYFNKTCISEEMLAADQDNPDIAGDKPCTGHGPNNEDASTCREIDGASQCYGFAAYVYEKIWGTPMINAPENTTDIPLTGTTDDIIDAFNSIPIGSHVRVGNDAHSVILLAVRDDNFVVYQANAYGKTCKVSIRVYDYDNYNYNKIDFYEHPNAVNTCQHNYVTNTYTETEHDITCSICAFNTVLTHNFSPAEYSDTQHQQICSVCGYTVLENHQFEYTYVDDISHSATCAECGDSVTLAHVNDYKDKIISTHTKYCLLCGHQWSAETHNFYNSGLANTCRQCNDCGYATTAHNLVMTVDGEYHKEVCSICNYQASRVLHSIYYSSISSSKHQQFCTYCTYSGAQANHSLSYKKVDTGYHRQECSVCSYKTSNTLHDLSYVNVNASNHKRECKLCDYETTTSAHSFTYTNYSSTQHTKACMYCSYSSRVGHDLINYAWSNISTHAQCERRLVACDDCTYSYYEYDYEHDYTYYNPVPSDIPGFEWRKLGRCVDCGYEHQFYY